MSTLVVTNLSLGAGGLPDGSVLTSDIADGAITGPKIAAGAVSAADLDGNQTGSAPIYGCRAWVNFDGTRNEAGTANTSNTNRFIRASGNVTSVLRNGVGDYTITFTTAMPNANYAVTGASKRGAANSRGCMFESHPTVAETTTSCTVRALTVDTSPGPMDASAIQVAIFC